MLENLSDYLSIGILLLLIVCGLRIFFVISNKNHVLRMKERENHFLSMISEAIDEGESSDED